MRNASGIAGRLINRSIVLDVGSNPVERLPQMGYRGKRMPKLTRKQIAVYYYTVNMGYSPVKVTSKYEVLQKDGINVYIGKNGAIRKGKNLTDSISLTDRTDYEKMHMKVEEHKRRE